LIVVDASIALAWCFKDEASSYADSVQERVIDEGAVVPAHWPLEVANGLLAGQRRGRIEAGELPGIGRSLLDLGIQIRPVELTTAFWGVLDLASEQGLSVYDAAYIDMCSVLGLELATLDQAMRAAGLKAGIELVL
jgi:predicted nucleic acid-binding protein